MTCPSKRKNKINRRIKNDTSNLAPLSQPIPGVSALYPITTGGFFLVDQDVYEYLTQKKAKVWTIFSRGRTYLRVSARIFPQLAKKKEMHLHRAIAYGKLCPGEDRTIIDHIDRDTMNNTSANLRAITTRNNIRNQKLRSTNTSGYKGVHFRKDRKLAPWLARIVDNEGKSIYRGFATAEEAAREYDRLARHYHGEYAATNQMLGLLPPRKKESK